MEKKEQRYRSVFRSSVISSGVSSAEKIMCPSSGKETTIYFLILQEMAWGLKMYLFLVESTLRFETCFIKFKT